MELSVAPDKVQIVKWHPLAKDILCTVAFDKSVKIWDLNKTENGPQLELLVSTVQIKDKKNLNLIGMSSENKKNAHLYRHLGASFIRLNELNRVSN